MYPYSLILWYKKYNNGLQSLNNKVETLWLAHTIIILYFTSKKVFFELIGQCFRAQS